MQTRDLDPGASTTINQQPAENMRPRVSICDGYWFEA